MRSPSSTAGDIAAVDPVLEYIATVGGSPSAVALAGNYAFLALGSALEIVDVSDPARAHLVGRVEGPSSDRPVRISGLAVDGERVYAVGGATLTVFDVSRPTEPRTRFAVPLPETGADLATARNRVYVVSGVAFYVLDITGPEAPRVAASIAVGGSKMALAGDVAYVLGSGVTAIDISDPDRPVARGTLPVAQYAHDIAAVGHVAVVVDADREYTYFRVLDFTDSEQPVETASLIWGRPWYQVGVWGHAYVASGNGRIYAFKLEARVDWPLAEDDGTMLVVDVADPAHPRIVGSVRLGGGLAAEGLAVSGGRLAVALGEQPTGWGDSVDPAIAGALRLVDVTDAADPAEIGRYVPPYRATSLAISGQLLCVADNSLLNLVDVTDPAVPQLASSISFGGVRQIAPIGDAGYFALLTESQLAVLDARVPQTPRVVSRLDLVVYDIAVAGGFAYGVDGYSLVVIDVRRPDALRETGRLMLDANHQTSFFLAIEGRFAYVSSIGQLLVVDVADPAHPNLVATLPLVDATAFAVGGTQLLVAGFQPYYGPPWLSVVDVRNPCRPRPVAKVEVEGLAPGYGPYITRLFYRPPYVFAPLGEEGLRAYDTSDPERPRDVPGVDRAGYAEDVVGASDNVFIAAGRYGVRVARTHLVDVPDPTPDPDATPPAPMPFVQLFPLVVQQVADQTCP